MNIPWWLRPWSVVRDQRQALAELNRQLDAGAEQNDVLGQQIAACQVQVKLAYRGEVVLDTEHLRPGTRFVSAVGEVDWLQVSWAPLPQLRHQTRHVRIVP